eukprot:3696094-Amphidinium_carterae.1
MLNLCVRVFVCAREWCRSPGRNDKEGEQLYNLNNDACQFSIATFCGDSIVTQAVSRKQWTFCRFSVLASSVQLLRAACSGFCGSKRVALQVVDMSNMSDGVQLEDEREIA